MATSTQYFNTPYQLLLYIPFIDREMLRKKPNADSDIICEVNVKYTFYLMGDVPVCC